MLLEPLGCDSSSMSGFITGFLQQLAHTLSNEGENYSVRDPWQRRFSEKKGA